MLLYSFLIVFSSFFTEQMAFLPKKKIEAVCNKATYTTEETIELTIKNKGKKTLIIAEPMLIKIEKEENGTWQSVRTLYCPCGSSCPPPPETELLAFGETQLKKWNQEERWCLEDNKMEVQKVGKGKFRWLVQYKLAEEQSYTSLYVNFTIE